MLGDPITDMQHVTRYNLIIAFEELYTAETQQLDASANAIGEIISAIQQLLIADVDIQVMLATHQLTMTMVAPARVATFQSDAAPLEP